MMMLTPSIRSRLLASGVLYAARRLLAVVLIVFALLAATLMSFPILIYLGTGENMYRIPTPMSAEQPGPMRPLAYLADWTLFYLIFVGPFLVVAPVCVLAVAWCCMSGPWCAAYLVALVGSVCVCLGLVLLSVYFFQRLI